MSKAKKRHVSERRFGVSVKKASELEGYKVSVYKESLKPSGTEARKRLKQLMTHELVPQVISSNDFSDKASMKRTTAKSMQGNTRTIGNKTDVKINSYFKAKRGDNLPR